MFLPKLAKVVSVKTNLYRGKSALLMTENTKNKNSRKLKTIMTILPIAIAAMTLTIVVTAPVLASHNNEPTMWVNGINPGQTHTYIYQVNNPNLNNLNFALMVKEYNAKPNISLNVTPPGGAPVACPATPLVNRLLVAECSFAAPIAAGTWQVSVTAAAGLPNPPAGYAISADGNP